jgi:outer membrane protein TolC
MRKLFIHLFIACLPAGLFAQQLTLDECLSKAKANYPLVKQYGLIEETGNYNLSNANKSYLPQLTLSAKATYQSDVTSLPESLAQTLEKMTGKTISSVSKDQYQAVVEANQLIWDGGVIASQKKLTKASTEIEKKKLDVDLYAINERVEQLYFGILLIDEQLKQNAILKTELQTNYKKVEAYKNNGIANQADLDAIMVEILNADQRDVELKIGRKSYLTVLGAFIGTKPAENTELQKPMADLSVLNNTANLRPELSLFDAQNKLFDTQVSLQNAGNMPRLGAFVQGGVGRPGLNMFVNQFSPFYIGGLRLSWNISNFYTQKNNLNKIEANRKASEVQRETFLFNTDLKTQQQKADVEKLQASIESDTKIIRLKTNIKSTTSSKLDNGTSSVTDLIRDLNSENMAIQLKSLHEVQLLMSIYQLKNNVNN